MAKNHHSLKSLFPMRKEGSFARRHLYKVNSLTKEDNVCMCIAIETLSVKLYCRSLYEPVLFWYRVWSFMGICCREINILVALVFLVIVLQTTKSANKNSWKTGRVKNLNRIDAYTLMETVTNKVTKTLGDKVIEKVTNTMTKTVADTVIEKLIKLGVKGYMEKDNG